MLASHPEICTASEPWLLLPLVYALREGGTYSVYDHNVARKATLDFLSASGGQGLDRWYEAIRMIAAHLYQAHATNNETYFLDKTPRYVLIVQELRRIFPEGKFVFLFRNPMAILASMIEKSGHANSYQQDLYLGLEILTSSYPSQKETSHVVRYEDLISRTEATLRDLCEFLDIPYLATMVDGFGSVQLKGKYGDKSTLKAVSEAPLHKWSRTLSANPWRRFQAKRYLRWVGKERLGILGYEYEAIYRDLMSEPVEFRSLASDILASLRGLGALALEPNISRAKLDALGKGERIYRLR
jgi:hypothetical protein